MRALSAKLTLAIFGLTALAGVCRAADSTGLIIRDPDNQIRFLSVLPSREEGVSSEGKPLLYLEGEFSRKNWVLYYENQPVTFSTPGVFRLSIPIHSERMTLSFVARSQRGQSENETLEVIVLNWAAVRRKLEEAEARSASEWLAFRLFFLTSAQQLGSFSTTGGASWNPGYRLGWGVRVRANLETTVFNKVDGGYFLVVQYGLLLAYPDDALFHVELGGGGQTWVGYGGTRPVAELAGVLRLGIPLASWAKLDSLFGSYTGVFDKSYTSQIKLGVTLKF